MKTILSLEEAAMFVLSIFLFAQTGFAWWWYLVLILAPDIGIVGYLFGSQVGAVAYNLFHHKAIAIVLFTIGWYASSDWVALSGIIMFGHSSLDRMLGYGLKYNDSFHHTHLGWIGAKSMKT